MTIQIKWHAEQADPNHVCDELCWFQYGYEDEEDVDGILAQLAQAKTEEERLSIEASLLVETDPHLEGIEEEPIL